MKVIEAPHYHPQHTNIFLGGGISNCPDWQKDVVELLKDIEGIALNPRRSGEFSDDIANEQIEWEYYALRSAETVFFWFPEETLCPITLLELGVFTQRTDARLIVGTHPNYARRFDVIKQLELARPEVVVQDSIEALVAHYLDSIGMSSTPDDSADTNGNAAWLALRTRNPHDYPRATWAKEDAKQARAKEVVLDELPALIGHGTLPELFRVIEANYKDIATRHVRAAVNELEGKQFHIDNSGNLLPL